MGVASQLPGGAPLMWVMPCICMLIKDRMMLINILYVFSKGQCNLGPVVNILAIFSNANILKKLENKNIPHQRYGLSVIDFD